MVCYLFVRRSLNGEWVWWRYDIQSATAIVNGHVAPLAAVFSIGKELTHEFFEGEAPLLENTGFAVLGEYHIFWEES